MNSFPRVIGFALAGVASALLAGCGTGKDGTPAFYQVLKKPSPGGFWEGRSAKGWLLKGVITESGETLLLVVDDGSQYYGSISAPETTDLTAASVSGTAEGYDGNGNYLGTATMSGTLNVRVSLSGTGFDEFEGTDSANLKYDRQLYERKSSLDTISGSFTDVVTQDVLTVNKDGTATMLDSTTGCIASSTVTITDGRYNVYDVSGTYGACPPANSAYEGLKFSGVAWLDNTAGNDQPEKLVVAIHSLPTTAVPLDTALVIGFTRNAS